MKKYFFVFFIIFFITNYLCIKDVNAISSGKSIIVMDIDSGRILYGKNIHEKKLIASTTKIMTAILAIENSSLDSEVTVGNEILGLDGTNIYVKPGEKLLMRDLVYGLLLRSGNDAAAVIAKNVSGSVDEFVKLMNLKAKTLGMQETIFSNPHGLDDFTMNYSTAYDMAILSSYSFYSDNFNKISSTRKYITKSNLKSYIWYNKNKLLYNYKYYVGGKNGYTPRAGRTLVSTASKNNLNLTIVTLNDYNGYDDHKNLYERYFSKYKNYLILDKENFSFKNNKYKEPIYIKRSFQYPLTLDEIRRISTNYILFDEPSSDNKIGYINILLDDDLIGKIDMFYKYKKKKQPKLFQLCSNIKNYLELILKKFMLGRLKSLNLIFFVPNPLEIYNSVFFIL